MPTNSLQYRQRVSDAAFKAWQAQHPRGDVTYTDFLTQQKAKGYFWSA